MKKTLTLTLALGAGLTLIGCKPATSVLSVIKQDTVALQATTALTLADGFKASPTMSALRKHMLNGVTEDPGIPVATLDILFNNGVNFNVESTPSDREGYEFMDTISFNIGDAEKIAYKLYYNLETFTEELDDDDDEVAPGTSGPVTPSAMMDDDDEMDDDDTGYQHRHREGDKHYRLRGLALVGEDEYRFMAKTESETEDDEVETELRFMLWKADGNFIHIKQEIEIEGVEGTPDYEYEEEFFYMVVENGNVVKQFKLELENEDNELELEVRLDGVKYEVEYLTVDGKNLIKVKVEGGSTYVYEKVINTDPETGETSVTYILQ